jgi:hypothetical protein
MENITTYKGHWWIPVIIAGGILLIVLIAFIIPNASADVISYGPSYNYSEVVLPNTSYVHQGENISQGDWYDLNGVYGFSGKVAHWTDPGNIGYQSPDQIVVLNGNPHTLTYIDPAKFPVGEWWQWDGQICDTVNGYCSSGFGHGNNYIFAVVAQQGQQVNQQERIVVYTSNITILQNGSSVQIPVTYTEVQTFVGTPVPTVTTGISGTIVVPTPVPTETQYYSDQPPNADVQDQNGIPINGGVAGAVVVTAKSPVPVVVPVLAIIIMLVVMRRKK